MKNRLVFVLMACAALPLAIAAASCSVGTRIDGTFSPADGATDVALDAAVTVVFTQAIAEPADWLSKFTLTAAGSTANACTSITYDAATLTATCVHDAFAPATVYTGTATGVIGYTPTSTFTTVGNSITTTMAKTSVASAEAGNTVTLTFTFSEAVSAAPAVAVDGATLGTCALSADGLQYVCPVSGIAGCQTLQDYAVTLTGEGIVDFSSSFNSADNEFENAATLGASGAGTCWENVDVSAFSIDEAQKELVVNISGGGGFWIGYAQKMLEAALTETNFSMLTSISSFLDPFGGAPEVGELSFVGPAFRYVEDNPDETQHVFYLVDGDFNNPVFPDKVGLGWALAYVPNWNEGVSVSATPKEGGNLYPYRSQVEPLYACYVRKDNILRTYVSFDGSSYMALQYEGGNGNVDIGGSVEPPYPDVTALDTTGWDIDIRILGMALGDLPAETITISTLGFVRFKNSGITGTSSADCPPL